jgi:GNAT superfamily N-acetyltransferase
MGETAAMSQGTDVCADLAVRFFDVASAQAKQAGVSLRWCDEMAGLTELNRQNRHSWPPLIPLFDTTYNPTMSGFWLQVVDGDGNIVGANAARAYIWENTTFTAEAESLRLFYADPAPHIASGDSVELPPDVRAASISGRTAGVGATWVHPDFRSRGLTKLMSRLCKVHACARWDVSLCWGFANPTHLDTGVVRAYAVDGFYSGLRLRLGPQVLPALLAYHSRTSLMDGAERAVGRGMIESSRSA